MSGIYRVELWPDFLYTAHTATKRGRIRVLFPAVRERVMIAGRSEVFLVVNVDHERGVADLIPLHDGLRPEEDVPLASLRRLTDHQSRGSD